MNANAIIFDGEDEQYTETAEIAKMSDPKKVVEVFKTTAIYRAATIHMLSTLKETPAFEFIAEKSQLMDAGYHALIARLYHFFGEEETLMLIASTDLDIKLAE
jgi:hypothetical protein